MPTLKQISCSLEVGNHTRLKEYDHRYTDGGVEAFVAIPETQIPFHIRIVSSGYIAPGLAAYVFMDGAYQCNRNRHGLKMPTPGQPADPHEYEVEFKLRQKEEKTSDGTFVAREWTFAQLKTGAADCTPDISSSFAHNVGTIEVVILRCKEGGARDDAIDPAQSVLGRHDGHVSQDQAASADNAATGRKPETKAQSKIAATKAPSKVSVTKAPSKAASKVASGADVFGGMFGLFDGAGDDTFATLDGVNDQDRPLLHATKRLRQQDHEWSPHQAAFRHGPSSDRVRERYADDSLDVEPHRSSGPSQDSSGERGDFIFIEESARQIEHLITQGSDRAKKHAMMEQEAIAHRNEPEVFQAMTRTLQRKAQEIVDVNDELAGLYRSIDACMRTMDRQDWQRVRGFLHQHHILPEMRIELVTPLPTPATEPAEADWQQPDSGRVRGSLSERKRQQQNERQAASNQWQTPTRRRNINQDIDGTGKWTQDETWGATGPEKSGWDNTPGTQPTGDADANQDNGGWGGQDGGNNDNQGGGGWDDQGDGEQKNDDQGGGGWENQGDGEQKNDNDGWAAENEQDNAGEGDGWNEDNNDPGDDPHGQDGEQQGWGDDDNGGGGGNDDAWGDQKDNNQGGGWGAASAADKGEAKSQGGGWGLDGARSRRAGGRDDTATTVSVIRPVIKPYWGEWATRPEDKGKPRARPRDAYVYPAPPTIAAPPGKPTSVSHGVQAGRGANYAHKLHRPEYLDTMQNPYAVFSFKYRSKTALQKILGRKIDTSNLERAVREAEEERLMRLPKDELVAELMKRQTLDAPKSKPASKVSKTQSAPKPAANADWNNDAGWGGGEEIKPSDSASNLESQNDGGWEQVGQGETKGGKGSQKSEQHWGDNDPDLQQQNAGW